MMDLEEMIRLAEEQARRVLVGTKEQLIPQWLLASLDRTMIVATPWGGDDEKHLVIGVMRAMMREEQVHAYSLLVEAWFAHEKVPEGTSPDSFKYRGLPPSQRPDRKESVVAMATNRYGKHLHRHWEIVRGKKGKCVDLKRMDGPEDQISGIFDNLLGERINLQ
jgi:hypothetical protein